MQYITRNKIRETLRSTQNRFNEHILNDDTIERFTSFIYYDDKKKRNRTRAMKQIFLDMKCNDYYRELVKEYSHIVISKGRYGRYYIQIKRDNALYDIMDMYVYERSNNKTTIEDVYRTAESFNKIHTDRCVTGNVIFPTGNILFANFFENMKQDDYAFDVPGDLRYKSKYSINHSFGEQNTMKILSETHGLGYVQLGNTSVSVYKVGDDKIIITTCCPYYYDEEGYEHNLTLPKDWEEIGEICCDVWRVEFIDQENFDKGKPLPVTDTEYLHNPPITCKVNPGKWSIKNRYHYIDDDEYTKKGEIPVWVELTRDES
ncbi:MAG: hypothetical protein DRG78_23530 [Epsilonproteobacteria bacterium]|nr:MAG: hypothetical protein DRG78_23530 [Campylobacterota bacterium]